MNRTRWLILATFLLIAGNVIWYGWMHWGLITIHSKNDPLSKVIHEIERQGHVTVKTNLDPSTPVHMWVDNVVLADALETLSTVTESRWRLAYFVAGDKSAISGAIGTVVSGQKLDGWKSVYYPVMLNRGGELEEAPVDPRSDPWNVKPATEPTAQAYLEQAGRSVAASFVFPESWNPPVKAPPKSGPITKALPRLASAANGKYEEVFLLQQSRRTADRPAGRDEADDAGPRFAANDDTGGGAARRGGGFNREAMQERMQAELDKLPADRRAALQKEMEERRAFFEGLRDLPPEQRDAKIQDYMSQPGVQEKMDSAQAAKDSRRSPEQKIARAAKYLANKATATGGAKP